MGRSGAAIAAAAGVGAGASLVEDDVELLDSFLSPPQAESRSDTSKALANAGHRCAKEGDDGEIVYTFIEMLFLLNPQMVAMN